MRPLLTAALAATLLACAGAAWWPETPDTVVASAPRLARTTGMASMVGPPAPKAAAAARPADPQRTAAAAGDPLPLLPTRAADWPAPPAAALAAWQAPPPPPPPPAAPRGAASAPAAAPLVPAFPYRWIGQLDDGGVPQMLLASAQRSVGVRLGATLDGRWRLQRSASGQLLAQALPDGEAVPVPDAPLAAPPRP